MCTKRWKSINSVTGSSYIEYNKLWYLYLYGFYFIFLCTIGGHRKRSHSSLLILLLHDDHPHCRFYRIVLIIIFLLAKCFKKQKISAQREANDDCYFLYIHFIIYLMFNVVGFTDFCPDLFLLETKESKKRLKMKKQTIPE